MTDASSSSQQAHEPHGGLDTARQTASRVLEQTREHASGALEASRDSVQANPLGVLAGGLAAGAIVGALIPRSAKEKELLAPVGKRLATAATLAVAAAKEAGKAELEARGLTQNAARDQAKDVFQGMAKALSSAGTAAAKKATEKPGTDTDDAGGATSAQSSPAAG